MWPGNGSHCGGHDGGVGGLARGKGFSGLAGLFLAVSIVHTSFPLLQSTTLSVCLSIVWSKMPPVGGWYLWYGGPAPIWRLDWENEIKIFDITPMRFPGPVIRVRQTISKYETWWYHMPVTEGRFHRRIEIEQSEVLIYPYGLNPPTSPSGPF